MWADREIKSREVPLTHHLHHSLRPILPDRRRVICLLPPRSTIRARPYPLPPPDRQGRRDVTLIALWAVVARLSHNKGYGGQQHVLRKLQLGVDVIMQHATHQLIYSNVTIGVRKCIEKKMWHENS